MNKDMAFDLQQRRFLRGRRRFRLDDDGRITATYQTAFSSHEYVVPLGDLTGNVTRVRSAKISNIVGAAMFVIAAAGAAFAMHGDGMLVRLWMVPPIIASPAVLLVLAYWRSIDDVVLLRRHDGSNAIVMFADSPDRTSVDAFVAAITRAAAPNRSLVQDARESIRRLFDLGILSADEARALSDRVKVPLSSVK